MSRCKCQHFQRPEGKFSLCSILSLANSQFPPPLFFPVNHKCIWMRLLSFFDPFAHCIHTALGPGLSFPVSSWWMSGRLHDQVIVKCTKSDSAVEMSLLGGLDDILQARKQPMMGSTVLYGELWELFLKVLTCNKSDLNLDIKTGCKGHQLRWGTLSAVYTVPVRLLFMKCLYN